MFGLAILLVILTIFFAYISLSTYEDNSWYIISSLVFGLLSMFSLEMAVESYSCEKTWSMSNTPSNYDIFTGCMIKVDDKWIPAKNYREFEE